MNTIVASVAIGTVCVVCVFAASCSRQEQDASADARKQLGRLGIELTGENYASAVSNGNTEVLALFSDCGFSSLRPGAHASILGWACLVGDTELVKLELQRGRNPNTGMLGDHERPIMAACRAGHARIVKILLANGADPNIVRRMYNAEGEEVHRSNALSLARRLGRKRIAKILLDAGAVPLQLDGARIGSRIGTSGSDQGNPLESEIQRQKRLDRVGLGGR